MTLPYKIDIEAVIKMGFWPGTPTNMCHLFARDLLDYWDMAQKGMPGVSERSFITSLEDFSSAKGRVRLFCRAKTQSRLKSNQSFDVHRLNNLYKELFYPIFVIFFNFLSKQF